MRLARTSFAGVDAEGLRPGDWRPLNLERAPFGFPPPREVLREGCTEQGGTFADKSLGLWSVNDLGRS